MNTQHNDPAANEAAALAEKWQNKANKLVRFTEKQQQKQMMRLIRNPMDKVILTKMIDQSFRSGSNARVADQVSYVLNKYGVPKFFSIAEKGLMQLFLKAGRYTPDISIPRMIKKIRADSARSVIPGEKEALYPHLSKRKKDGVRMNLNHLGEAVLGEGEAQTRLDTYLKDMEDPEIEYISVKISTIYSQINSLAFENTVDVLKNRLTRLFRTAKNNIFVHQNGTKSPKFVNLDMEEYRDLEITLAAFTRTLDQPEFKDYMAGIVLQAYLPDSFEEQKKLTRWARERVAGGGSPIKVRIVKGANMEMEQVDAAIHNWPLAPYDNKPEVDANYKRMVDYGMKPENIKAVHLGIASHNLFEQAYAYITAKKHGVEKFSSFEMLEGMANHVWRAIREVSEEEILLYAPVATRDEFINAIAYLIRRLDENTAEENFLRYSFNLKTDSEEWEFLKKGFFESCDLKDKAKNTPNRIQDRSNESFPEKMGTFYQGEFNNEPDTDWSLGVNRKWAEAVRDKWMKKPESKPDEIPVVVAGKEIFADRKILDRFDPNQINDNICIAKYALANNEDAELAVKTAKADPDGWRKKTCAQRHEILSRAAMELRAARGDLIGSAAADTGKVFTEADPEVSEAVDFAEFYPWTAGLLDKMENIECRGKGVGLVITPWNFPIAIPCGGIAASLAAGNTVIFKPASAAVITAWHLCQCFWKAGVPKNTLQFIPCSGSSTGPKLTGHLDVDYIILTGGTDTGMEILKNRPGILLAAETGGKNATIVTAMADRDQAVKNILHSAFSNCGQKCSATSLVILEKEVFEDENFKKQFVDAAKSYLVGSAWDFKNKMAALIAPPKGDLKKALTQLEPGEQWALKPENIDNNPYMWTPGIKWNVQPGSYTHMTEFFGPVVGVMCAENLEHAVELVNQTGYGLTSGLESLDKREVEIWKDKIEAGNLYINRGTTGAIVLRQPFGGMKKSALGAGIKAGSPNYVTQFMEFEEKDFPKTGAIQNDYPILRTTQEWKQKLDWGQLAEYETDLRKTIRAIKSYIYNAEQEFFMAKDYFRLRGEDNIMRYLPLGTVLVRVHEKDSLFEVLARIAGAKIAGCSLITGLPRELENNVTKFLYSREGKRILDKTPLIRHTDQELIEIMPEIDRIRYADQDRVPAPVFEAAAKNGIYISRNKVMMEGRIEMLHYFQEQTVSHSYHRYGNLGERGLK
ncbi:1-pyrroline-5-carboxylate dehydrogenase [Desulfonema limicola]|uniref:L-glutamate gamma-semialdehyde dehydrogenase n=1 Tax=Desulfonema limicola TaxID=45656 RepID=A0A975B776_9BACT|nr:bifunctional proline dehydrogenase/L-glutamate gamma-semialdehyde dehydrogenase [Desulfonema limicola]QTA80140.1 1-pyrroline-5-carboxylate dehydrogenase [Desulfonema limicola]